MNLLAIAKLRPQLRTLNVCADCVMTLQYGHLQMNHQFVEDDDGNDAFIQYGICTNSIQTIVSSVLGKFARFQRAIRKFFCGCLPQVMARLSGVKS